MSYNPIIGQHISNKKRDFANHLYSAVLLKPLKPGDAGHILWLRAAHHKFKKPMWFQTRSHLLRG